MQLDAQEWLGFFPFCLSDRHAVDHELYSYIVNAGNLPTTTICNQLKKMATDHYYEEYQHYLFLVRTQRVKSRTATIGRDGQQRMQRFYGPKEDETAAERQAKRARERLTLVNRKLATARSKLYSGLPFHPIIDKKHNRNNLGVSLKYLGVTKLRRLVAGGISTGTQLLESDDPVIKPEWRLMIEQHFDDLREQIEDLEAQQNTLDEVVLLDNVIATVPERTRPIVREEEATLPPAFSQMYDKCGYNAKLLSWSQVNSILRTEFAHRKEIQDSKMRGLTATILKFDFNYETAKKMRVWVGPGRSYRPFICILTVQNEHGLTVFWKALKSQESLKEVEDDLKKLDRRLMYNAKSEQSTVLHCYIDNCCAVSKPEEQLKKIFPNCGVGLDAFHWQQRWDPSLEKSNSKEAGTFRGLMRRALFAFSPEECERAKTVVMEKKGRAVTTREIVKEARSAIPEPDILRERVLRVLNCVFYVDAVSEADRLRGKDPQKCPKFFKSMKPELRKLIERQLHHIDHGCLSDPKNVDIHITNPKTNVHYIARGTSLNETDNKYLNLVLGAMVGIDRADRLLGTFFEVSNDKRMVRRMGSCDYGTHKTEVLALLNSLAKGAGYGDEELPFPELSAPTRLPNHFNEALGLNFNYDCFDNVSNPTDLGNENEVYSPEEIDEQALHLFLGNINFDTLDESDNESEDENEPATEEEEPLLGDIVPIPVDFDPNAEDDHPEQPSIDREVEHVHQMVLDTLSPETSLQSFARMTNHEPWIPFRSLNSSVAATDLEREEYSLFARMKCKYKRHVSPGLPRVGYRDFELAWNMEVAERYRRKLEEEDTENNIVMINRKSYVQLQQHYDDAIESERLAGICDPNCPEMKALNHTFQTTRQMTALPTGRNAEAIQYRATGLGTPFGAPTVLNPTITERAINGLNQRAVQVPWRLGAPRQQKPNYLNGFQGKTWCMSCGFQKREHDIKTESFGSKCKRNYCSKCYQMKEHHVTCMMGPRCTHQPCTTSPHSLWYLSPPKKVRPNMLFDCYTLHLNN